MVSYTYLLSIEKKCRYKQHATTTATIYGVK